MIAPTKRMDAIGSGIPLEDIYSTVLPKPAIFPGMADMNIADIATPVSYTHLTLPTKG